MFRVNIDNKIMNLIADVCERNFDQSFINVNFISINVQNSGLKSRKNDETVFKALNINLLQESQTKVVQKIAATFCISDYFKSWS